MGSQMVVRLSALYAGRVLPSRSIVRLEVLGKITKFDDLGERCRGSHICYIIGSQMVARLCALCVGRALLPKSIV
jgi:hypothetical protein